MSMQTDVKSTYLTAAGSVFAGRRARYECPDSDEFVGQQDIGGLCEYG